MCANPKSLHQRGATLIELVIFIVIVSVAVVGILSVMNITSSRSADPMIRKQALAIAESLMEEIQLQSYTFCDPDDANATTATAAVVGAGGCAVTVQGLGPSPAGETRYNGFDNVGDYHGFGMNGILRIEDAASIGGLGGYNANVTLAAQAVSSVAGDLATCLRIQVTVVAPAANETVTLDGYRCRYAPRAVP